MPNAYFGGFVRHPTPMETRKYMRGECAYWALAAHALMPGSALVAPSSAHFAVRDSQGYFWDIRGRMDEAQMKDGLAAGPIKDITRDQVMSALESGVFSDGFYVAHRERQARKLIGQLVPSLTGRRHRPGL